MRVGERDHEVPVADTLRIRNSHPSPVWNVTEASAGKRRPGLARPERPRCSQRPRNFLRSPMLGKMWPGARGARPGRCGSEGDSARRFGAAFTLHRDVPLGVRGFYAAATLIFRKLGGACVARCQQPTQRRKDRVGRDVVHRHVSHPRRGLAGSELSARPLIPNTRRRSPHSPNGPGGFRQVASLYGAARFSATVSAIASGTRGGSRGAAATASSDERSRVRPLAGSVGSFAEPPGAVGVARSGSD